MARCLSSSCLCPPDRVTLRISNWVDPSNPVFELWVLHVLTVPLGGALTPQTQPLSSQSCPCVPHSSPRRTPSQLMTHPLSSPGVLVALCCLLVDKDTRARLRWTNFKVRTDLCAWEWSGGEGLQGCVHPPLLAPPHPTLPCPPQAALHSWRRGEESEVSEYNVQQQVYHRPPESSSSITRSTRSTRSNSQEPIFPESQK